MQIVNNTNTLYTAKGMVLLNGEERLIAEDTKYYSKEDVVSTIGLMGVLIDVILTILITFIFTFSIPIALIVLPIPSIILAYMGLISISTPILWTIEIIAVIIAILINDRG